MTLIFLLPTCKTLALLEVVWHAIAPDSHPLRRHVPPCIFSWHCTCMNTVCTQCHAITIIYAHIVCMALHCIMYIMRSNITFIILATVRAVATSFQVVRLGGARTNNDIHDQPFRAHLQQC